MHHIQQAADFLNALRQLIEPLRSLTWEVSSYVCLVLWLRSRWKKGQLRLHDYKAPRDSRICESPRGHFR